MSESLVLGLPNGKACHFTSAAMRTVAKYLRWETFKRGQYSHAGFELQDDDTVVDIGANIGMFVLLAEPQVPRDRLICIEPNPYALECLKIEYPSEPPAQRDHNSHCRWRREVERRRRRRRLPKPRTLASPFQSRGW